MTIDYSIALNIVLSTAALILTYIKFIVVRKDRSKEREEAIIEDKIQQTENNCMSAVSINKTLLEELNKAHEKHNRRIDDVERRVIDKDTLSQMIESRVGPVEESVSKLSEVVNRGFSDMKQTQTATEQNIQKILERVSDVSGSFRTFLSMNKESND